MQFVNWFLGCLLIYAFLFGIGYLIFGAMLKAACFLIVGAIASATILRNLRRVVWQPTPGGVPQAGVVAETREP